MAEVLVSQHGDTRGSFMLAVGNPYCLLLSWLGDVLTGFLSQSAHLQFFLDSQFHIMLVFLFATSKTGFIW